MRDVVDNPNYLLTELLLFEKQGKINIENWLQTPLLHDLIDEFDISDISFDIKNVPCNFTLNIRIIKILIMHM